MNAIPTDLKRLLDHHGVKSTGHRGIPYGTQYHLVRGSETNNLNVFHTGKVSVDGKASGLKNLLESWRLAHAGSGVRKVSKGTGYRPSAKPRAGIDEAGKGEYLGPLVVAGARVLVAEQDRDLREIGVRDSKDLGITQVRQIASGIERILGSENIHVIALEPKDYEFRRTAAGSNVNRLLAELDVEIIHKLEAEVELIVVDKFGERARFYIEPHVPEGVELEVRTGAEDDTAVAAASILARARYLEEMDKLSERAGFELPRGSTHVFEAARRVYEESGMEGLAEVAKIHFAITQQVVDEVESQRGSS